MSRKLKIALLSDWHLGITKSIAVGTKIKEMQKEVPDLILTLGDSSGEAAGAGPIDELNRLLREAFPTTSILMVMGNHDWWAGRRPRVSDFAANFSAIEDSCRKNNIVNFEVTPNVFVASPRTAEEGAIYIAGAGGWYSHEPRHTNDSNFLPSHIESATYHHYLLALAERNIATQMEQLDDVYQPGDVVILATHFPVLRTESSEVFDKWCWNSRLGREFAESYQTKYFMNGHSHQLHQGTPGLDGFGHKYEAGSDYEFPRYQMVEIGIPEGENSGE